MMDSVVQVDKSAAWVEKKTKKTGNSKVLEP